MNTIVVILAALLVVASAQIPLCYKAKCQSRDQDCGFVDTVNYVVYGCKGGLGCSGVGVGVNGTCQNELKLNDACVASDGLCRDSKYDITCFNSVCLYPGGLGPSEDCSGAVASDYVNGNPCAGGSTCSSTCSGTSGAQGATCSDVGDTQTCASGLYCAAGVNATSNHTCQPRLDVGAQCGSTSSCKWNLICTTQGGSNFTCQTPFSQASGSSCESLFDCKADLFCDGTGKCANPDARNQDCTQSSATDPAGTCPDVYSCECSKGSAGSTNGKCQTDTVSQSTINDINNYWNCMSQNCKFDASLGLPTASIYHTNYVVSYTPDSCANKKCSGSYSNVKNYVKTLFGSTGCSGSPANVVSVFAFLVFAMAAIALMF